MVGAARTEEEPGRRARMLEEAADLWRGEPMADLGDPSFVVVARARLEEQRLAALELGLETGLELGRTEQVVEDARSLVDAHPYRERGWQALMLALYRCGRQSEAIAAARQIRFSPAMQGGHPVSVFMQLEYNFNLY